MRLEEGERVGDRYTLRRRLGSGGMADVWLADDEMLGRPVALKFLHERFAQDAQFVERFRREAQSAAGLQHPNVVGVYDRGEADGRYWIAMEYVEGAALNDLIARGLSIGEAVEIVRQVLTGARFAHERGIVHRDLKPQNVLVDREGRARVADFGIARAGASEITQTGSVLGTAQYLSPEQAQGLEVGATSDLYSIGVMLYEGLTGHVPFEADTPVAVALKQVSERPRPPSVLNPQVSPALDAVVLKALAKDPADRFQTANEFLSALDAAEADPNAGPGTAAYPAVVVEEPLLLEERSWLSRNRWWVLGGILLLAAALVAIALLAGGSNQVTVPPTIGKSVDDAQAQLERQGFDVSLTPIESCKDANTVIEQDPPAGTKADEGSTVNLTTSLGQSVKVPDVVGMDVADATKQLQDDQLLVSTQQRSSPKKPGTVVESDPAADAEVQCQSKVTLFISKGVKLISLPDLTGLQQEDAEAQLDDLGLIANVDTRDADEAEGTVIDQSPAAGSQAERGDTIRIVVSSGAGSVVLPNVVGQPSDTAVAQLKALGAAVDVERQETDVRSEDGRVLDQAPAVGTRIRQGDTVTIFVGQFVEPEPTTTTTTTSSTTTTPTTTTPKQR
jgi:serine/threonine-protein kinase